MRITTREDEERKTLLLEGRVEGPWVGEFDRAWRPLATLPNSKKLRIDLSGVTYMNADGRHIPAEIHKQTGAEFIADTPMTKYFAEEAWRHDQEHIQEEQ